MGADWLHIVLAEVVGLPLMVRALAQLNRADGGTSPMIRMACLLMAVGAFIMAASPCFDGFARIPWHVYPLLLGALIHGLVDRRRADFHPSNSYLAWPNHKRNSPTANS
ncbi:hypothetical protein SAMN02949497_1226 [Methylomagnum ishizawai]|uniref:Uncharacterized protein n=1 Tax=Methylomagnum ishizawai TaxID=1760988 RepID=A0A1Y6CUP8_9GAMM|nr:hypothetical protein [Methylomagnum ishizawai]SMF93930.1 hypothetical protein SAMN02949497_1226 [Methylomagnum ishizawai]